MNKFIAVGLVVSWICHLLMIDSPFSWIANSFLGGLIGYAFSILWQYDQLDCLAFYEKIIKKYKDPTEKDA